MVPQHDASSQKKNKKFCLLGGVLPENRLNYPKASLPENTLLSRRRRVIF